MKNLLIRIVLVSVFLLGSGIAMADQVILDDLIVDGSGCVGFDCVNGESFGFDTLRLKENNLRIHFEDTSSTGSFPSNDWRIAINDSSNGGANYFAIQDATNSRTPFTIEANAPANALYVEDYGRIGLGTAIPYVELHIVDGDSPTVRLDQDGSSGWAPQRWDICGNETNFFIRDVTNGSKLCFRIQPNTPSNTLCMRSSGNVGIGTWSPDANLHVQATSTGPVNSIHLENTAGPARLVLENKAISNTETEAAKWVFNSNGTLRLSAYGGNPTAEFVLDASGNLTLTGSLTTGSSTVYPDYVFEDDYELMSLPDLHNFIKREGHLPNIATAEEIEKEGGINMTDLQIKLLEKVEELTLYTLNQQKMIDELKQEIQHLKK